MSSGGRAGYQARDPQGDDGGRPVRARDGPAGPLRAGEEPPSPAVATAALARGRRSAVSTTRQAGMLLGLQRTAGNAYVQRLLGAAGAPRPERAQDEAGEALHPTIPTGSSFPLAERGDPGAALPEHVRAPLEGALGADFTQVRVHTGPEAAAAAAALDAQAYTAGRDIVFGAGAYAPDSSAGRERLAHELTHVLQQQDGPVAGTDIGGGVSVSDPSDRFEQEAARTAEQVVHAGLPDTRAGGRTVRGRTPTVTAPAQNVQRLVRDPAQRDAGGGPAAANPPIDTAVPMSAQATAAAIDPATLTQGTGDAERAANDIYRCLAMPNPAAHTEEILQALLGVRGRGDELTAVYHQKFGQNLTEVLDAALGANDAIRVRRYLQYGTLRLADKIFFAARGAGSDEDTLYRLMREARGAYAATEQDFVTDYGTEYGKDGRLPDGRSGRLAGMLDDEMDPDGADNARAKATLVYGEPRPADRIRMATAGAGTDEEMLFAALEAADRTTIRQEYKASYQEELDDALTGDLSFGAQERAMQLLAGQFDTMARIRYAVGGLGTDEQMIFDTLSRLPAGEKAALLAQFNDHSSAFYQLLEGDLNQDGLDRVQALLAGGASMGDALKQAGATDGDAIVATIKMTSGEKYEAYRRAYLEDEPGFWGHVRPLVDGEQMRALRLILTGTPEQRLRWAIEGTFGDDEDYIFHVLQHHASDDDKRRLAADTALLAELESALSTSDMNRVRGLLTPGERGLQERVSDVNTRIEREGSWVADAFSNASDALADEQRELNAALVIARADGAISAGEQAEIQARLGLTEGALDVYISVRDELENTTATILTTAAGILIAVASGGLASGASAAMIAAALAKAAVASAVTRVVVTKIARGDRFDIIGADGAIAFGAGAIDGVMNVVGTGAAQRVVGPLFGAAMREATVAATGSAFQTVGRTILLKAAEGSLSGAASALFESAANESTWKGGFEAGVTNVLASTGSAAGMGAGLSVGLHYAGEGVAVAVRGRQPHLGGAPDLDVAAGGRGEVAGEVAGGTADIVTDLTGGPNAPVQAPELRRPPRASVSDTPTIPDAPAIDDAVTLPDTPVTGEATTIPNAPAVDEAATIPSTPAGDTTLVDAPALDEAATLPAGTPLSEAVTQPAVPATPGPEIVLHGGQTIDGQALPAGRIPAQVHPGMANVLFDPRIQGLDIDAVLAALELTPTGARIAEIIRTGHAPDGTPVNVRFVRPEDFPGLHGLQEGSDLTIAFEDADQAAQTLIHEGVHFLDPVSVGGVDSTYLQMEANARAFEYEWAQARGIEPGSPAYQAAREAHEQAYMDAIVRRSLAGEDSAAAQAGALREANIAADRAMIAYMRAHPADYAVESPAQMQQLLDDIRAQSGTLDDVLGTPPAGAGGFLPPESALEDELFGDLFRDQQLANATTRTDATASTLEDTPTLVDQPALSDSDLATQPAGGTIPVSEGDILTQPAAPADATLSVSEADILTQTANPAGTIEVSESDILTETGAPAQSTTTADSVTAPLPPVMLGPGQPPPARVLDPAMIASDTAIAEGANKGKRILTLHDGRRFIFKPAGGEKELIGQHEGILAGERYRRGAAAAEVAAAAGIAAPPTEVVIYQGEIGQLQEWVSGPHVQEWFEWEAQDPGFAARIANSQLKKDLDAFDYLIANMDRNHGNLLVEVDPATGDIARLIPIDMDIAFPPSDVRYTLGPGPVPPYQMPLPDTISAALEGQLRHMAANRDALMRALAAYLTQDEVDGMLARLDEILQQVDSGVIGVAP